MILIIFSEEFSMFSKITSLLTNPKTAQPQKQHFIHPQVHRNDISQCPFMRNKLEKQAQKTNTRSKLKKDQKVKKNDDSQPDSESDEKPRGGCPFLASSGSKKNPDLGIDHEGMFIHDVGYHEPFVSKFKYYLSQNKINFNALKKGKQQQSSLIRQVFDQYPIYLQHTLFYSGEDYKKIRSFECLSRFMAYEELRERGNRRFNRGKYLRALDYYEKAMSLFRWLQYKQQQQVTPLISTKNFDELPSQSQISDDEIHQKISITLNKQNSEFENTELDLFKTKYKQFFIIYHDRNVACHNGEQITEETDNNTRKSLLIQLYLNMSATYIKLNNYQLAIKILNDALVLSGKVSQIYLRKAQAALCNKSSSMQELKQGLEDIKNAIQMKSQQKIFQTTNVNLLKMCNIHDAKEVYQIVFQRLNMRIKQEENKITGFTQIIEIRLKQLNEIEKKIIREGKVPQQRKTYNILTKGDDYLILSRIYRKYIKIIEFYLQTKDMRQVQLAKKQFQQILKAMNEIKFIQNIQINIDKEHFGNDPQKINNRIKNIKEQKCQIVYNSANYNFQVLEWAIKQNSKQEHQKQQMKKKQQEQAKQLGNVHSGIEEKGYHNWIKKLPYAMVMIPIVGILINYLI